MKKTTNAVYFRCDPDNGSNKCAELFFIKLQKENIFEKLMTRCYVTGEKYSNGCQILNKCSWRI